MTTTTIPRWPEILLEMAREGYRSGLPRRTLIEVAAGEIDSDCCRESACEDCGHESLDYRPFILRDAHGRHVSYRAFAVCSACSAALEF